MILSSDQLNTYQAEKKGYDLISHTAQQLLIQWVDVKVIVFKSRSDETDIEIGPAG